MTASTAATHAPAAARATWNDSGPDRRVGIEMAAAVLGQLLGHVDHAGRVQLPDGLFAHGFVSARGAFLDQAGLVEPGGDAPQAIRSFRDARAQCRA